MAEALAGPLKGLELPNLFVLSSAGAIFSQTVKDMLHEHLPNVALMDNFGASETGSGYAVCVSPTDPGR